MGPSEEGELFHVVALDQWQHEPNKSNAVKGERYKTVIFHHAPQEILKNIDNS